MKLWLVKSTEEYGDSYPLKVFVSEEKANRFVLCLEKDAKEQEDDTYNYYVTQIEADLNE